METPQTRKEHTMTRKEFFNAIITANINEELNEFAAAELEKMEAQRERAAEHRRTAASSKNEPMKADFISFIIENGATTANDLAARFEISTQRATGLAGSLVKEGRLAKSEVKIPKVGKRVCYEVVAEGNDD